MKKRLKRFTGLALAAALLTGLAAPALAAEPVRGEIAYTEIIAPQYEDAKTFSEGLAAVKKDGKWGYIDETGKQVIPCKYEFAYNFNEGVALVVETATVKDYDDSDVTVYVFGLVDASGAYTPVYSNEIGINDYGEQIGQKEGLGRLCLWMFGEFDSDYPHLFVNGYLPLGGQLIGRDGMPLRFENSEYYRFYRQMTEGLIPVVGMEGSAMFYIDETGKKVVDPERETYDACPFNQGMAIVLYDQYNPETDEYYGRYGFIDQTGKTVIAPQFTNFYIRGYNADYILFDEMGRATVEKDGKWGAIDKTGKTVIDFVYDRLMMSTEGRVAFEQNGKWGFLDSVTLQPVIAAQYDQVTAFSGGYAVVCKGSSAKLIDRWGNAVKGADKLAPSAYFQEQADGSFSVTMPDDIVTIEENGKYGFGKVEYVPNLPKAEEMSSWAYDEVCAAIEADLVPVYLQNLYQQNITRDAFADTIVQAMEAISGEEIDTLVKNATGKTLDQMSASRPFKDSSNENVIAANALGVISGYGDRTFLPENQITRQEAASMLMRAAKALGAKTDSAANAGFADTASIATWAQAGVNYVYEAGVMAGTGQNKFSPAANYTREQTYMTVYRLLKALVEQ